MGKKLLMLFAFVLLFWDTAPALRAQAALPPLTHAQEALIRKIEGRLMTPCCYTQTIRDHDSQVAVEMRDEVTAFVASGKSEQEIITYYRTKYGETILVVPDGLTGQLLTTTPLLLFVASASLLVVFIRKAVSTKGRLIALSAPVGVAAERADLKQRIRAELGDF
jgi:cytochrome c-type biogenesis protein CcmH